MSSKDQERNRIVVICELNKTHLKTAVRGSYSDTGKR